MRSWSCLVCFSCAHCRVRVYCDWGGPVATGSGDSHRAPIAISNKSSVFHCVDHYVSLVSQRDSSYLFQTLRISFLCVCSYDFGTGCAEAGDCRNDNYV